MSINRTRAANLGYNGTFYFFELMDAKEKDPKLFNDLVNLYGKEVNFPQGPAAVKLAQESNTPNVDWSDQNTIRSFYSFQQGSGPRRAAFDESFVNNWTPSSNSNQPDSSQVASEEQPLSLMADASVGDVVGNEEGLGRYGQGFVVTEDGLFHNISPEKLEELRADGVVPIGTDPSLWNDVERIRARNLDSGKAFNEYLDSNTGNKFVFKDGGLFSTSAVPQEGTPTFIGNNSPSGALVGSTKAEASSTVQEAPAQATVTPPAAGGAGNQGPFLQTWEITLEEDKPKVTKKTWAIAGAVALVLALGLLIFL